MANYTAVTEAVRLAKRESGLLRQVVKVQSQSGAVRVTGTKADDASAKAKVTSTRKKA